MVALAMKTQSLGPLQRAERDTWIAALEQASGSMLRAAKLLGKSRNTAMKKVRQYGLRNLTMNPQKYNWRKGASK